MQVIQSGKNLCLEEYTCHFVPGPTILDNDQKPLMSAPTVSGRQRQHSAKQNLKTLRSLRHESVLLFQSLAMPHASPPLLELKAPNSRRSSKAIAESVAHPSLMRGQGCTSWPSGQWSPRRQTTTTLRTRCQSAPNVAANGQACVALGGHHTEGCSSPERHATNACIPPGPTVELLPTLPCRPRPKP
jgi:hypothetical protein